MESAVTAHAIVVNRSVLGQKPVQPADDFYHPMTDRPSRSRQNIVLL